jgi:hypothetical protein
MTFETRLSNQPPTGENPVKTAETRRNFVAHHAFATKRSRAQKNGCVSCGMRFYCCT